MNQAQPLAGNGFMLHSRGAALGYARSTMPKKVKPANGDGPRNTMTVTLTESENAIVDGILVATGMGKAELMRRLIAWFAGQPDVVRKTVLGIIPEELHGAAADVLNLMAAELVHGKGNVATFKGKPVRLAAPPPTQQEEQAEQQSRQEHGRKRQPNA